MSEERNTKKRVELDLIRNYNLIRISVMTEKARLRCLEKKLKLLLDKSNSSAKEEILLEAQNLSQQIESTKSHLHILINEKSELDQNIKAISEKCNDLETKVFYYHYVRGMTLAEVAQMVCYSEDWVRKVNAKLKKM